MKRGLFVVLIFALFSMAVKAQITAPGADGSDVTQYPDFSETDDIYIFCTVDSTSEIGALTVSTALVGTKTFLWEKYNETSASFELVFQESSDGNTSQISNLEDGCYRSTVTLGAETEIDRAWVFSNWTVADASVTYSDCELFRMSGAFKTAILNYYDLSSNAVLGVFKNTQVEWKEEGQKISSLLNVEYIDPPTKDTEFTFRVFDKFSCEASVPVLYESIVTKAEFTVDAKWTQSPRGKYVGEAPLEVSFINQTENGTPGYFEWFFYRDIDEIKEESEGAVEPVDSIMFVAYDDAPVYTYENSGSYLVKLVSKHISEFHTCVDTFRLDDYLIADTAFIVVPNVFTPKGSPGVNDNLVVKFWSMQSLEINIFNRWGKRVHYWESGDVRGFEETYQETVWDGKIGNRYASPGVYYYVVTGKGRDGKKKAKNGFVHLFREK